MTRTARIVVLLAAPVIAAAFASTAHGHARLKNPTPRDNRDGYKDMTPPGTGAPCGIARTAAQPSSTLTPGATVTVTWEETVNHAGCFVLDFSAANDGNFQVIGRKSHMNPSGGTPRQWSMSVTLPSAPCTACTLRLRQMMLAADVSEANLATGCPPATVPANSTYYSCANVVLGGGGASGTGGSGGSTGGTGAATGAAGRGGNTGGGRGGTLGTGGVAGSTSGQAGNGASGAAGTSGQAGDNGQAGTSGQAGSGSSGEAGTTGQAGSGSSGEAGVTGQAGNGSSGATGTATGQAGTTGGSGGEEVSGGCQVAGGAPAPLAVLLALVLFRRRRPRSRS